MLTSTNTRKPIIIIQGGQYGSEAKGLITAKVVKERRADICVRTGTVNAGHTVYYKEKAYAMQQLPVGWVRVGCTLVVGAGAYIDPAILERELNWISAATGDTFGSGVLIDINCGVHLPAHTGRSTESNRHYTMGATGKGSSEAVMDKIRMRGGAVSPLFRDWLNDHPNSPLRAVTLIDTTHYLNREWDTGKQIVIEGTQGTLLDLHLGPYPYTTHKQTQAANWLAECGLSCMLPVELISVMRAFPIRVAGNSGPLPREISWTQLATWISQTPDTKFQLDRGAIIRWGAAVAEEFGDKGEPAFWPNIQRMNPVNIELLSEGHGRAFRSLAKSDQAELKRLFEMTTVTKKLRRIAQWDWTDAARSIMFNRPSSIALTFLNYSFPEAWGITRRGFGTLPVLTRRRIIAHVREIESRLSTSISSIGFGPDEESNFALYPDEEA